MFRIGPTLAKVSFPAHHSEPGNPILLEWMRPRIDDLPGLGPGTIVIILGLLIVALPLVVMATFLLWRPRQDGP